MCQLCLQVAAGTMVNEKARVILEKYGISKIFDGFGHQPPTTLTLHNYPDFLTKVDIPGALFVTPSGPC